MRTSSHCFCVTRVAESHLLDGLQGVTPVRAADAAAVPTGNRGPPSLLVRLASAFLYIVPWIDILTLGREIYHFFPTSLLLYLVPGEFIKTCTWNRWCLAVGHVRVAHEFLTSMCSRIPKKAGLFMQGRWHPCTTVASLCRSLSSFSSSLPSSRTTSCTTLCASTACRCGCFCSHYARPACPVAAHTASVPVKSLLPSPSAGGHAQACMERVCLM